jgi:hypothetical protein
MTVELTIDGAVAKVGAGKSFECLLGARVDLGKHRGVFERFMACVIRSVRVGYKLECPSTVT